MLDRLFTIQPPIERFKHVPPEQMTLNYILLESSSLKGTEFHQFNAKFALKLRYINDILVQVKRYAEHITVTYKI